jgi:glycosyltransferase involved in cell wall biosynthesis
MPKKNKPRLKVLLISDFAYPLHAGTERLVFGIAEYFTSKFGIQVDILSPDWDVLKKTEKAKGVTIYRFRTHSPGKTSPIRRIHDYVSAGLRLPKYDIYHGFFTLPALMATVALAKLRGGKSVLSIFGRHQLEANFTSGVKRYLILKALKSADAITTTFWSFRDYLKKYHFPNENLSTVQCWVEGHFKPTNAKRKGKQKMILFVGRMVKQKGIFVLLEAMEKIKDETDAMLYMVGPPVEKERILRIAHSRGIGSRIKLVGYVQEGTLVDWYNSADVVVAPTFGNEAFTWTLMEAMACGKPIISTERLQTPGNTGDIGIVVPPNDSLALSTAILKLLNNKVFNRKCSSNALRASRRLFDKGGVMRKYLALYRRLL